MVKVILALLPALALSAHAQGRVVFNNIAPWNPIDVCCIGPVVYPGGDYSIQLLWAPGTNYSTQEFYAAIQGASFPVSFLGVTGGSPNGDGAGLFDGGTVAIGSVGDYTMMVRT